MGEQRRGEIIADRAGALDILGRTRRIAVLGIKPETKASAPAHYVPAYLQKVGYEVIPVPTYYPEITEMLGVPVYRKLTDIPGDIDLVVVFRRSEDVAQHVDEIVEKAPAAVWFQLGIENDAVAEQLAAAGIDVVQNRCTMIDHRMLRRAS
jgi:predicted CoA-binding protein